MARTPLPLRRHRERHRTGAAGWLRAAVLGSNDGLVSTASLMVGVAASSASGGAITTAGLAGLAAGAMSMAVGEWVSVSSQGDIERADLATEQLELAANPDAELNELTAIYQGRGLPHELARQVAVTLHAQDALAAHLRDELGHTEQSRARPIQAGLASVTSFVAGGLIPFLGLLAPGVGARIALIVGVTLVGLLAVGVAAAWIAGGVIVRPTARVVFGGAVAMAITAGVGALVGAAGV